MFDKSLLKKSFITLLAGILSACSQNTDFYSYIPANNYSAQKVVSHGDIAVKFNNAYKALYTDNEKTGRADPENPDKLFIKIIDSAKKSLDIAVFDLEEPTSCKAIINARKRGVKVRIVTDSDNLGEKGSPSQPRKVLEEIRKAGIPIREDRRNAFMHHKFVIMDDTVVLTGSLNLTSYSMYRDNNNSLKITSPELAASYKAEFNRLFNEGMFGPNSHEIPYQHVKVDGADISLYFSPRGGTKAAILKALGRARKSIKFMAFSITDNDIQNILMDKSARGVGVEGIFDGCMISKYSVYQGLLTNEVPVFIDGNQALLHDKVFIIDNRIVITGSYNFSRNAEERNNENTLIIESPKIAGFYLSEYNRLKKASLNNKVVPPYNNRDCSSKDSGNDIIQEQ